jgi:hypothetical protein
MKKTLGLLCAISALMLFVFSPNAFAKKSTTALPYYLEGWSQPADEFARWETMINAYVSVSHAGTMGMSVLNNCIKETITYEGSSVVIYFDSYFFEDNVVVEYSTKGKKVLTKQQFELVKQDTVRWFKAGVDYAYSQYEGLKNDSLTEAAALDGKSIAEMTALIAREPSVMENAKLILPISLTKRDFVSHVREFHFAHLKGGVLGLTFLHSGKVFCSPIARLLDHINNSPVVVAHELVHANPKLQNILLSQHIDLELLDSLPVALDEPVDSLDYFQHPYLEEFRKMVKVLTGMDSERAIREIIRPSMGTPSFMVDREKLREHVERLHVISKAFQPAIKEMLASLYRNPLHWMAVNERMQDKSAFMKVFFALKFDPTSLGGHQESMLYLDENASVLKEIADEVWNAPAEQQPQIMLTQPGAVTPMMRIIAEYLSISPEQALRALKNNGISAEEFFRMSARQQRETIIRIFERSYLNNGK